MTLDARTLLVTLAAATVLMALAFSLVRGHAPGSGRWGAGLCLLALGSALAAARAALPPAIGVALADALLFAGLIFQLGALYELQGRATAWSLLAGAPVLLLATLLPFMRGGAVETMIASAAWAIALLALCVASLALGEAGGPVRRVMAATFFVGAVAILAAAVDLALDTFGVRGMLGYAALQGPMLAVLFAVLVTSSFCFLILQRDRAERRLEELASYDPLTALYNRRAFMDLAGRELARARRSGTPFALLVLDLDGLKRVNEAHGIAAGDRVLTEFARRLTGALRADDIAGRRAEDEFCVYLCGATRDTAPRVAERIRSAVEAAALGGAQTPLTASIGAAVCEIGSVELEEVLAMAEQALLEAKSAGGNRVAVRAPEGVQGRRAIPRRRAEIKAVPPGAL